MKFYVINFSGIILFTLILYSIGLGYITNHHFNPVGAVANLSMVVVWGQIASLLFDRRDMK